MRWQEPLAKHTTFRIGGPADAFIEANDSSALSWLLGFCHENAVGLHAFGRGSNVLVSDQGLRGVVFSPGEGLSGVTVDGDLVVAGAGATLDAIVNAANAAGLVGIEFLAGIPGTVAGALATNAGAFGHSIAELIEEISGLDPAGQEWRVGRGELVPRYREPLVSGDRVVTQVKLRLGRGTPAETAAEIRRKRWEKHPTEPSAGSFFKNPVLGGQRVAAGKLIDECGLKGRSIGGARVSEKHANFIVNTGGACFADVYELAQLVKARVEERFKTVLEEEVRVLPGPEDRAAGAPTVKEA